MSIAPLFKGYLLKNTCLQRSSILTFLDLCTVSRWRKVNTDSMLAKELWKSYWVLFYVACYLYIKGSKIKWHISEGIWHTAKFDLRWPLVISILTWAKKGPKYFRMYSLRAIESFSPRFSILLSFCAFFMMQFYTLISNIPSVFFFKLRKNCHSRPFECQF